MFYDIKYTETSIGWFEVEADSEEDALAKFWKGVYEGEYNLLDTLIEESNATAFEQD